MNRIDRVINLQLLARLLEEMQPLSADEIAYVLTLANNTGGSTALVPNHRQVDDLSGKLANQLANPVTIKRDFSFRTDPRILCDGHVMEVLPMRWEWVWNLKKNAWYYKPNTDDWRVYYKVHNQVHSRDLTYLDLWSHTGSNRSLRTALGKELHRKICATWSRAFLAPLWRYPAFFWGAKFPIHPETIVLAQTLVRERYGWYSPSEIAALP